jgi:hypothetical protein
VGVPGGERYAFIISCIDVIDFLKSSKSDLTIGLIFDSYRVETKCRPVARCLSERGHKGEPDAPNAAESEIVDLLR